MGCRFDPSGDPLTLRSIAGSQDALAFFRGAEFEYLCDEFVGVHGGNLSGLREATGNQELRSKAAEFRNLTNETRLVLPGGDGCGANMPDIQFSGSRFGIRMQEIGNRADTDLG